MILLIEGHPDPLTAKTAINLIRYKREEVVAIFDSQRQKQTSQAIFGLGGDLPVVGDLAEVPEATTLVIGIAPTGGQLPKPMRTVIMQAIARKLEILSGLHEFLADDPEIAAAARLNQARLIDVRRNRERDVSQRKGLNPQCLRIQTVGNDCNVGKMVASLELTAALTKAGCDAKFIATGQTGIMIEGAGCPIDAVVADFVNGAAEKLVLANQHHEMLLIEGQGSLIHPRYSSVTLGLLHGCVPQGLILCYEMGREFVGGMDQIKIPSLAELIRIYEIMANVAHPCKVLGIAINGRKCSDSEVAREREKVRRDVGLPVCDVLREGPGELVEAILWRKQELRIGRK